jgi:hypothetical protein
MFRIIIIILAIFFVIVPVYATSSEGEIHISIHGEYGWFNKVYKDLQYKDQQATTFAVQMENAGFEFFHKDNNDSIVGIGIVGTHIDGGSVWNGNRIEKQPRTSLLIPYTFTGINTAKGALELGIGWYLTVERMEPVLYFNADGSEKIDAPADDRIKRTKSFALINIAARLFPESGLHFKFRYARERFNGIDSLCNAAAVIPIGIHAIELYFSLPSDWSSRYMPQSNQRFGIVYSLHFEKLTFGVNAGYLSYNHRGGGDGNMPIFDLHNFSFGSEVRIRW